MKIGAALKALRIALGLNQTEMSAGVISESYYSKVERGLHNIDADLLFEILKAHNVSLQFFLELLDNIEDTKAVDVATEDAYNFSLKMSEAENLRDRAALDKVAREMEKIGPLPESLKLDLKRAYSKIDHNGAKFTAKEKLALKKQMFKNNNWAIMMPYLEIQKDVWVLDFKDIYNAVNQAIRGFEKLKTTGLALEIMAGATVVVFLQRCQDENVDKKYVKTSIEFLRRRSYNPQNLNALLMGAYFEAWFDGDHEKAENIIRSYDYAKEFKKMGGNS